MFTILRKRVKTTKYGNNVFDRYFEKWANGQQLMEQEVSELVADGAKIIRDIDRMNAIKGFYEYEKCLKKVEDNETYEVTYALIDAYFQD